MTCNASSRRRPRVSLKAGKNIMHQGAALGIKILFFHPLSLFLGSLPMNHPKG